MMNIVSNLFLYRNFVLIGAGNEVFLIIQNYKTHFYYVQYSWMLITIHVLIL